MVTDGNAARPSTARSLGAVDTRGWQGSGGWLSGWVFPKGSFGNSGLLGLLRVTKAKHSPYIGVSGVWLGSPGWTPFPSLTHWWPLTAKPPARHRHKASGQWTTLGGIGGVPWVLTEGVVGGAEVTRRGVWGLLLITHNTPVIIRF